MIPYAAAPTILTVDQCLQLGKQGKWADLKLNGLSTDEQKEFWHKVGHLPYNIAIPICRHFQYDYHTFNMNTLPVAIHASIHLNQAVLLNVDKVEIRQRLSSMINNEQMCQADILYAYIDNELNFFNFSFCHFCYFSPNLF